MKIRIVHVLYSFGLGGLEGMVAGLINNMDADTFSHSICVLHDDLASFKKIRAGGASVYVIKRHFTHDPSVVIRMAALFRKIRPDIVRTYNWAGMEGIVAARLSDIKTVIHSEHGSGIVEAHRACRAIERRILLKNCAGIIAVSKAIQSWLVGYIRIGAESNTKELTAIDPKKMSLRRKVQKPISDIIHTKKWVIFDFPTNALAQDAEMSLEEFRDFVFRATNVDWAEG